MNAKKHRRLQELDRSDFEIVDGQPDIRGWDVKNSHGQKIGDVEDLIIDVQQRKVRYMVVDLDDNELDLKHRKVLIPIGLAELHREDDDVMLPAVDSTQLSSLPAYDRDRLDADMERTVCDTLGRKRGTTRSVESQEMEPEFYQHDYYNDDNLYRHRLRENKTANTETEYEKGLQLWERRSQGGILPETHQGDAITGNNRDSSRGGEYREREIEENARMEMVRNRRDNYQQRRREYRRDDPSYRKDNSFERRIKREGLRDPGDV